MGLAAPPRAPGGPRGLGCAAMGFEFGGTAAEAVTGADGGPLKLDGPLGAP